MLQRTARHIARSLAGSTVTDASNDLALAGALTNKLRSTVLGFIGLVQVQADTRTAVYEATPSGVTSLYSVGYSGPVNALTLGRAQPVVKVTSYEPTEGGAIVSSLSGSPMRLGKTLAQLLAEADTIPPAPDLHARVRAAARANGVHGVVAEPVATSHAHAATNADQRTVPRMPSLHDAVRAAARVRGVDVVDPVSSYVPRAAAGSDQMRVPVPPDLHALVRAARGVH